MKYRILSLFIILSYSLTAQTDSETMTIYDYTVQDISGQDFPLAQLKGKKVMIVNTASECGLTPQYESLQDLYSHYQDQNFVIIGFPANNFMAQEPGTNEEITAFCQKNYGVTFPMMSKIDVKGDNQHALYQYLTQKKLNGFEDSEVKWNFQKYLIGLDGNIEKVIGPQTLPRDEEILNWING